MRKRALRKDFYVELRRTFPRFLSILLIVFLGVAFFAGVRASEPDMKLSADKFYDESRLMDLRVVSTLGLDEDDVSALSKVDGIKTVMPAYSADVLCNIGDNQLVVRMMSAPDTLNQIAVSEGRMPERADECLADTRFLEKSGFEVGDVVTVSSGTEDDIADSLSHTRFTIVGSGSTSYYLSLERGTSSVGSGELSSFLIVPGEAFSLEAYTDIYMEVEGAAALGCYEDEYEDLVEEVSGRVEALEDERCRARYDKIKGEAEKELADARKEVADAEKELADARKELEDGEKELADGKKELADKKKEFEDAKEQLEAKENELAAGQKELEAKEAKLKKAKSTLSDSKKELTSGRRQLKASETKLQANEEEIAAKEKIYGEAALAQAREELAAGKKQLEEKKAELEENEKLLASNETKLARGERELEQGKKELSEGAAAIERAKKEIEDGESELAKAEKKLADSENELADARTEFEKEEKKANKELAKAKKELEDGENKLAELEYPSWYVLDRNSIETYVEYGQNAERIGAIGEVFPVIFFLVAALVSLTTMTRMVEEERTQIGTLKALGYGKRDIAGKYFKYSLFASILGSILGAAAGQKILPVVIINAYKILYNNLPDIVAPIYPDLSFAAAAAAIFATVAAAMFACYKELLSEPANLMRPAAPKAGKRVLLERVGLLWRHLSFAQKAAVRNLFRYKKRFFMTILGIGGCTALLLVGYGLKDSIVSVGTLQFGRVFHYDSSVNIEEKAEDDERDALLSALSKDGDVESFTEVRSEAVDAVNGKEERSAYLVVPKEPKDFRDYISLQDRATGAAYGLGADGAVFTEKLAKLLGVTVGDTVTLRPGEGKAVKVKVAAVAENYFYHYIYMSPKLYEKLFGGEPEYNAVYTKNRSAEEAFEEDFQKKYMEFPAVSQVSFMSGTAERIADMLKSLDMITYVLVVSAALLAFVVLYNLNNINISERRRELATLKVLGFYDAEVSAYVFRENILLTLIGTAAGLVLGKFLHRYVIVTAEVDMLMFGRSIEPGSYLVSIALTAAFSVLVNALMHFKLKKVDMVESMKSVE